jgi:type IV pilus assembly protein PilW
MSAHHSMSRCSAHHLRDQQGYTLLEILVALFIGVFLLAGLFTILQNTRRTSSNQSALAQLQDQQRMAMSILGDVVQNAGYFDPNTITSAVALPAQAATGLATGNALIASQGISGSGTATTGDILLVRYATNGTGSTTPDNLINCNGATSVAATNWKNTFYVTSSSSGSQTTYALYCSTDGTTGTGIPLVTGVTNMQVYYGVSTTASINNVDTYMTANQVQASTLGWAAVTSVRVTLTFQNPLYNASFAASTGAQYTYLTRVIPLQGRTGVIATAL